VLRGGNATERRGRRLKGGTHSGEATIDVTVEDVLQDYEVSYFATVASPLCASSC
jgi:hypothetical protein